VQWNGAEYAADSSAETGASDDWPKGSQKATQEEYTRTRNAATRPKRTGTRWPESTRITPIRCSPKTAKTEYTRRDTPRPHYASDRGTHLQRKAGWQEIESISTSPANTRIYKQLGQRSRHWWKNVIKDLCQLIKTRLGEVRFEQV
jgi:hypothetical protein